MNSNEIFSLVRATLEGVMPFSEIVGKLIDNGIENYHVDYLSRTFTFYSASGDVLLVPITFENLPPVSDYFDLNALRASILDSQQHGQKFHEFCERATKAGVVGYFAFLIGRRVLYLGRQGEQHTEWFPGSKPNDS